MATATATELDPTSSPALAPLPLPVGSPDEVTDRAEQFLRLPIVRTLTARVVVAGRLKPLPLPELED